LTGGGEVGVLLPVCSALYPFLVAGVELGELRPGELRGGRGGGARGFALRFLLVLDGEGHPFLLGVVYLEGDEHAGYGKP